MHNESVEAKRSENEKRLVHFEAARAEEQRRFDNLVRAVSTGVLEAEDTKMLSGEIKCNLIDLDRRIGEIMQDFRPIPNIGDRGLEEMRSWVNSLLEEGNSGFGKLAESLVEGVVLFPSEIVVTFSPALPATKKTAPPDNGEGRLSSHGGEGCPSSVDKHLRFSVTRGL